MDLALNDPRVNQRAAVVHHAVPHDLDLGGQRIGLHDNRVHAGRERRTQRRKELAALDPRLVALGHRGRVDVAARELGRRPGGLVERVPQRVGQHGHGADRNPGLRIALDPDDPLGNLQVVGRGL